MRVGASCDGRSINKSQNDVIFASFLNINNTTKYKFCRKFNWWSTSTSFEHQISSCQEIVKIHANKIILWSGIFVDWIFRVLKFSGTMPFCLYDRIVVVSWCNYEIFKPTRCTSHTETLTFADSSVVNISLPTKTTYSSLRSEEPTRSTIHIQHQHSKYCPNGCASFTDENCNKHGRIKLAGGLRPSLIVGR